MVDRVNGECIHIEAAVKMRRD